MVQQIIYYLHKAYLVDIRYRTTSFINLPISDLPTHLQDPYGKLMTPKLLEQEDVAKKKIRHHRDPMIGVYVTVEELLGFSKLSGTPI